MSPLTTTQTLVALVLGLGIASPVHAQLILFISDAGSGNTRWQFSGATQVITDDGSPTPVDLAGTPPWTGGAPAGGDGGFFGPLSGSGTVSINSVVQGTGIAAAEYNSLGIGLVISPVGAFGETNTGDIISWSGDMVFPIPMAEFIGGAHSATTLFNIGTVDQPMIVNIAAVPEPTTLAVCSAALSLDGLMCLRKKRPGAVVSSAPGSEVALPATQISSQE